MLEGKRILISGGAGSVGSELVRQLAPKNSVFILDINETAFFDLYEELRLAKYEIHGRVGDIRDIEVIYETFDLFSPDVVFHCAALKHVTPNEWYPEESIKTNALGTFNVVRVAKEHGVKDLVYVSTDKVINAHSVMGVTKKLGELIVRNAGYIAVRFGNVLGSRGSVIPIWQKQIQEGKPLTVTDERMTRYFMNIEDACELLIESVAVGEPGDLLIMDMGEPVNILKIAKEILGKMDKADYPINIIGIRPGETLSENLMTSDEKERAIKKEKFWVLRKQ